MRKFLGTLVIIALIVAVIGFVRGWFGVSAEDQPGETNVELRIDKEKIKQDAEAASVKARELTAPDDGQSADTGASEVEEEDSGAE